MPAAQGAASTSGSGGWRSAAGGVGEAAGRGLRPAHVPMAKPAQLGPGGFEVALGTLGPGGQPAARLLEHLSAGFHRATQFLPPARRAVPPARAPRSSSRPRAASARTCSSARRRTPRGLYGDLPPGVGPLLELPAKLIDRAFAAYAAGDQETRHAHLAGGLAADEEVFTAPAERVTLPAWRSRVDSPHWVRFLAHGVRGAATATAAVCRAAVSPQRSHRQPAPGTPEQSGSS